MTEPLKQCRVLLVDDTRANLDILIDALKDSFKLGVAMSGVRALEYVRQHPVDLILLDVMMPEVDGFEVCRRLKRAPETAGIPVIFITALDRPEDKTRGFDYGAVDYITKPFDIAEVKARVRTHLTLVTAQEALRQQNIALEAMVRERTRELEETQLEIINRLGLASEYSDECTGKHVQRISDYCRLLGRAAGLPRDEVELVALASTMHDAGKIGISDAILLKPGALTDEEWVVMKQHAEIGGQLLSGSTSRLLCMAEEIALTHHERWDGTGYPKGLKGPEIPLYGRIVCICDVFDALVFERPYKKAWSVTDSLAEISEWAGRQFDPWLAELFLGLEPELTHIVNTVREAGKGEESIKKEAG
ncbi:HD-GYP domain-containing protein [Desulfoluna spongiiphila]|uniref:Putative two-component system response regulator n=1 Tax=Desulfoluna spongiiphila TaxID=419481 RepID=A0A1G5DDP6_9BACT|nr:HD domain-containing phosphohydrolase [Desulfoluna spongiiphila]SCY12651.1 putative two-component system response regulator [Desulfoluna spongiiphila]VVS95200.1 signal transduction response regulator receiver domain [Desulfoluna spongiiphila]